MGLTPPAIQCLILDHAQRPFEGPLLTLGVQDVMASYEDIQRWFAKANLVPHEIVAENRESSSSVYLKLQLGDKSNFVHERTLFEMMGIKDYAALDAFDCEGATLVHDLTKPVPRSWHGQFGTIIDGGTIEHIVDLKTVFTNIVSMLRVGGSIVHISPISGWVNHGFFQISPCLFYEFYEQNGFETQDGYLIHLDSDGNVGNFSAETYSYEDGRIFPEKEGRSSGVIFRAHKTRPVAEVMMPTQRKYFVRERMAQEMQRKEAGPHRSEPVTDNVESLRPVQPKIRHFSRTQR